MSPGASKPLPSAKPSRKTAKRHTGCQLFSGNVPTLLPSPIPDSSRQRFTLSSKPSFMLYNFTLQDLLFKSRNFKATVCCNSSWRPKGEPVVPQDYSLFLLFIFFWGVGIGMLWPGTASAHCLWHVLWSTQC